MPDDERFARLVSLACHDLRTPLATVYGFTRTLARTELEAPADRYVEMIKAASDQLDMLIEELAILARIEAGSFDPHLVEVDSLQLASEAAAELEEGRVEVAGSGGAVRVPEKEMRRALAQLARAASRHGGLDSVSLAVDGATVTISPVTRASAPVLLAVELRDLGAASATALIRALAGSVEVEDDRLVVELPS
jgi:two-component system, OmpR family, sensor histidine kinase KdpD